MTDEDRALLNGVSTASTETATTPEETTDTTTAVPTETSDETVPEDTGSRQKQGTTSGSRAPSKTTTASQRGSGPLSRSALNLTRGRQMDKYEDNTAENEKLSSMMESLPGFMDSFAQMNQSAQAQEVELDVQQEKERRERFVASQKERDALLRRASQARSSSTTNS